MGIREEINHLMLLFQQDSKTIASMKEINDLRVNYLGKKSRIQEFGKEMASLEVEERKAIGKLMNEIRTEMESQIRHMESVLITNELNETLKNEIIDMTLPSTKMVIGSAHPLERIIEEMEEFFISMGYDVVEGPEVEKDLYNFEMLNLPKGHPARDAQDSFYVTDEMLLRSQTSPVQVRTMLANNEKTPIRILCPGKTYRRDSDDATHSHQFAQIEGLLIDREVSLADLKGTFDIFAKKFFGKERETRFRPSFYPFTEPSVELDISCFNCGGKGCAICKGTGWITIGGAGVVHPNVLRMSGYDPEHYTGFAFGMGVERIAMLKYGIPDIRTFYTNDLRMIRQFDRKGGE